ncbi:MAG: hypothetical protein V4506_02610 [Bacteroidota bacterium]
MSTTAQFKASLKKEKALLIDEIALLKNNVNLYKEERKAEWNEFKTTTKNHIEKIEKSLDTLNSFLKVKPGN